ncbi:Os11g0266500, partial [Oryza sativa Japonica Group]
GGYRGIYITVPRGKPGNRGNRAVTVGKSNPATTHCSICTHL